MPSALMLINPISGTRDKKGICDLTASRLKDAGIDLEIALTQHKGHGADLARAAAEAGTDIVVAAGGDGTVNEVASALMHTDTALGIIPCGSGNGLARSLGLPMDFDAAIDIIAHNRPTAIDCGVADSRPFFCTFGVGFDAVVTEKFASADRRGKMQYVRSALLESTSRPTAMRWKSTARYIPRRRCSSLYATPRNTATTRISLRALR